MVGGRGRVHVQRDGRVLGRCPYGDSRPRRVKIGDAAGQCRCKVMIDREAADSSVLVSFKSPREDDLTPAMYLEGLQVCVHPQSLG